MEDLRGLTYEEISGKVASMGEKPWRALQAYRWVFQKGAETIGAMTDLSKAFRGRLEKDFFIGSQKILDVKTSKDGTKKFLTLLEDGNTVESVIIPEEGRATLCVSTQVGCALGCGFCMTGKCGFVRNLKLSELTGQVFSARKISGETLPALTNIVLMGMGEPLLNYENVLKFIAVLTDRNGLNFSHNRVTVSTAGVTPGIRRLGADAKVNLAVSLNAATDALRTRLMPVNKKYPLRELVAALKDYPLAGKKRITIEYVLLEGINDTPSEAEKLARLLGEIRRRLKINLIPFNPFPGAQFKRPDKERVLKFGRILRDKGFTVVIRESKGADIQAACGQLRAEGANY